MIFNINCKNLFKSIKNLIGIFNKDNKQWPILSNILIKFKKEFIFFFANNTEMQIEIYIKINLKIISEKTILVNANKFINILKLLQKNDEILLNLSERNLCFNTKNSKFCILFLKNIFFPLIEIKKNDKINYKFKISINKIKNLFNSVFFFMNSKEKKTYSNTMLLNINKNTIYTITTDGNKLAYSFEYINIEHNNEINNYKMLISQDISLELIKLFDNMDINKEIQLNLRSDNIKLIYKNIKITFKTIMVKFPNCEKYINIEYKYHFIINRLIFLNALRRSSLILNNQINGISLIIKKNNLKIISSNFNFEKSLEIIDIDYIGNNFEIGLNIKFLINILTNIKSDKIKFSFNDNQTPITISNYYENIFKYILMPMDI